MATVIGSLARNLHQGSRTEYLAQYVFSGLGSVVAIPHHEDSGIDLYCTLGTPDPNEARRVLCGHPFYVQVKSNAAPIEFGNPESIKWLTSLPQPYFVCIVSQKNLRIQLYHSLPIFFVTILRQIPNKLMIELGAKDQWKSEGNWPAKVYDFEAQRISVVAPIVDFSLHDIVGVDEWYDKAHQILEGWLKLSEFNIAMRTVGMPIVRYPNEYRTNEPLDLVDHINDPIMQVGSHYTESFNAEYARERKDLRSLCKRVYASLLLLRSPDEPGEKLAWLLEHTLKDEGSLGQKDVYNDALIAYRYSEGNPNQEN